MTDPEVTGKVDRPEPQIERYLIMTQHQAVNGRES